MRERIRKAGEGLLQMLGQADANYANALYNEKMPGMMQVGHTHPLLASPHFRTEGNATTRADKMLVGAANAGVIGANIASRYALPAGVATAGAVGLYNLTQQMTTPQTTGTLMPDQ